MSVKNRNIVIAVGVVAALVLVTVSALLFARSVGANPEAAQRVDQVRSVLQSQSSTSKAQTCALWQSSPADFLASYVPDGADAAQRQAIETVMPEYCAAA